MPPNPLPMMLHGMMSNGRVFYSHSGRIEIDLMWNRVLKRVTRWIGYLPAMQLRIGSDNETRKTRRQIQAWVEADHWVDDDDGFDYGRAALHVKLPPTPCHFWVATAGVLQVSEDLALLIEGQRVVIGDRLWLLYGQQIQQLMRDERAATSSIASADIPDGEPPF